MCPRKVKTLCAISQRGVSTCEVSQKGLLLPVRILESHSSPTVFEALGGLSELAVATLSNNGRLLGQGTGVPPFETAHRVFHTCAISLWKGNAGSLPPSFSPIC